MILSRKGIVLEMGVLVAKFFVIILLIMAAGMVGDLAESAGVTGLAKTIIDLLPIIIVLAPLVMSLMMGMEQ